MRTSNAAPIKRRRLAAVFALVLTVATGLITRSGATWLPTFVVDQAGDALWSVALYCTLVVVFPRISSLKLGVVTFLGSACVECSQLIQTPAAIEARRHTLVRLLIGTTFVWSDFPRYLAGSVAAACVDFAVRRRFDAASNSQAARNV